MSKTPPKSKEKATSEVMKINPEFEDSDNLQNSNGATPEGIKNEISRLQKESKKASQIKGLFEGKAVDDWTKESQGRPIPNMLFSEFWYEGELCILFADTNQGKSILAVQIAESISRGVPISGFKLEAEKQKVLLFDFELSTKQFEGRYAVRVQGKKFYEDHYSFDRNLIRIVINNRSVDPPKGKSYEDYLIDSIVMWIEDTKAKILIIDNLTYLKNDNEKSNEAAPFIKRIQTIIDTYEASILVLAHTPKRNLSMPITRNDLQGSKRLIDFCDSSFAIGESHRDASLKYIKQIKVRETEFKFSAENVIEIQIEKPQNFLKFKFLDYGVEKYHLFEMTDKDRNDRIEKATEMRGEGSSNTDIARHFGVSEGTIRKWFKRAES